MTKFNCYLCNNTTVKVILVATFVIIFVVVVFQQPRSRPIFQGQNEVDFKNREKHLNGIWNYVYQKQYECTDIEEIGGNPYSRDGFYPVCKDTRFWKLNENNSNK